MAGSTGQHGAEAGFTLIELLVAILVLIAVVGISYTSLDSVTTTTEAARRQAETLRFRQYLWRNLSTNLNSLHVDSAFERAEFLFEGVSGEENFGAGDSLRFCTSLPMSGPYALPGVLRVVSYTVGDPYEAEEAMAGAATIEMSDPDAEEAETVLIISETPLMLGDTGFIDETFDDEEAFGEALYRTIPIESFEVDYYDYETEEWVEEWDSMNETRLPWAVRVRVNFMRSEADREAENAAGIDIEEEADIDLTIALPVGAGALSPFVDLNHQRFTQRLEEADAASGVT